MSDGIKFDDDSPFLALTVRCGLNTFQIYRGEMQGVENIEDHIVYALVMPPPLADNHVTDLDRHPELATSQPSTNKYFLSGLGGT